jgi:hypothetical protein
MVSKERRRGGRSVVVNEFVMLVSNFPILLRRYSGKQCRFEV